MRNQAITTQCKLSPRSELLDNYSLARGLVALHLEVSLLEDVALVELREVVQLQLPRARLEILDAYLDSLGLRETRAAAALLLVVVVGLRVLDELLEQVDQQLVRVLLVCDILLEGAPQGAHHGELLSIDEAWEREEESQLYERTLQRFAQGVQFANSVSSFTTTQRDSNLSFAGAIVSI